MEMGIRMKTGIHSPTVLRRCQCPGRKTRRSNGRDAPTRSHRRRIRRCEKRAGVPARRILPLLLRGRIGVRPGTRRSLGRRVDVRLRAALRAGRSGARAHGLGLRFVAGEKQDGNCPENRAIGHKGSGDVKIIGTARGPIQGLDEIAKRRTTGASQATSSANKITISPIALTVAGAPTTCVLTPAMSAPTGIKPRSSA